MRSFSFKTLRTYLWLILHEVQTRLHKSDGMAAGQQGSRAAGQQGSLAASAFALFVNFNIEQIFRRMVPKQVLKLKKLETQILNQQNFCSIFLIDFKKNLFI